ncbi:hypothetical protein ACMHYJ_11810 [Castellaniella hirudinis]|uniref:hypothetical protein n=1 Tax=Castellaniella hirudinis TaxID=1144617 RepID=UPI0039C407DD
MIHRIHTHALKASLTAACALLVTGAGFTQAAPADDMARLYALPPAGSVYVRVVNATRHALDISMAGQADIQLPPDREPLVSAYYPIPGDQPYSLTANQQALSVDPAPPGAGFVSLLVLADGENGLRAQAIVDKGVAADGLKAELAIYNLIPGCTAEISLESGQAVFTDVAFQGRQARAINPIRTGLTGACGAEQSPVFILPELKGGDHFSLFLLGDSHSPILAGALNQVMPSGQ